MTVELRDATPEDIDYMSIHMRLADKREVYAASGDRPRKVLENCMKLADCYTGLVDNEIVAMFGCTHSGLSGRGAPWMLGTNAVAKNPLQVAAVSKRYVAFLQQSYYHLENYVDCRNSLSIRWLKWLGFKFDKPVPYGPFGKDFMRFYWEKGSV